MVRQSCENVAKIRVVTERCEQRLDRSRPPAERQLRFLNQPLERENRFIRPTLDDVHEGFGHRRLSCAAATSERLNGLAGVLERGPSTVIIAGRGERRRKGDERAGVLRKQLERPSEHGDGFRRISGGERGESCAVVRVHVEFRGVKLVGPDRHLAIELLARFALISAREPDEPEQPVKSLGRVALFQVRLSILDDRSFSQHGLGTLEVTSRNVYHRHFEMGEWKVRIQFHGLRQRTKPILAPLRVRKSKLITPIARLEGNRATCRRKRLAEAAGTDQKKRQRGVCLGEVSLELDCPPHVIDRPREQRRIRLTARARHLVLPESRVRETDVCECIPGIQDNGALEVSNGAGNKRRIEGFQPYAPFGERLIGLEAAGLAICPSRRGRVQSFAAERLGELRDDAILQLEDLLELAVGLGLGQRFTGARVDHARGNPKSIRGSLKASDDRKVEMQLLAQARQISSHPSHGFNHTNPVDDPMSSGRAEIVGHRFSNARRQPGKLFVRADVGKVEDANGRRGCSCRRLMGLRC